MISSTPQYQTSITADGRRIYVKAIVDISDPDIIYGNLESSGAEPWSNPAKLHDKDIDMLARYATLEHNRWMLDGSFNIFSDNYQTDQPVEYALTGMSDETGGFDTPQYITQSFFNVSILQSFSLFFSSDENDGLPVEFTAEVFSGQTAYYSKTVTQNTKTALYFENFTVYDPTSIKVTVTKWSLPFRRVRMVEIVPGIYEQWDGSVLASLDIKHQADISCLSLPYGTAQLSIDNSNRRFDARNKNSLFKSIEERQGIELYIGVQLPNSRVEYKPVGIFYQKGDGWKTSDNDLRLSWDLVDIIGLLSDRTYLPPETLPITLSGWLTSVVGQLGNNFANKYSVDPDYASVSITANSREDVSGKNCKDIIRWVCMAAGVFPRADAETGVLCAEPLWNEGSSLTLYNLTAYPVIKANNDVAAIIFHLADETKTEYVISGNSTSSGNTITIDNPFIHTSQQALVAARLILSTYGGNQLETTGRGNPVSEIGDVDTVWLDKSSATSARRTLQTFQMQNGVLQGCQSTLLQADGSFMFEDMKQITETGIFTAPAGVSRLRLILVGKGQKGTDGTDGTFEAPGQDGLDGAGGRIWSGTIDINEEQVFNVFIGDETTFGPYTSAAGQRYTNGFTDIQSGSSYGRSGVESPLPGSGDGGAGGKGGVQGNCLTDDFGVILEVYNDPGKGGIGSQGAAGCAVIYWDKG